MHAQSRYVLARAIRKEPIMSEAARYDESAFRPRAKWIFLVFALIGAFLLLAEHRAHIVPWLPWLLLAA